MSRDIAGIVVAEDGRFPRVSASPGATNEEIADDLCISVNTVKSHLRTLYRTFGVGSRSEILLFCVTRGIIEPEECFQQSDGHLCQTRQQSRRPIRVTVT